MAPARSTWRCGSAAATARPSSAATVALGWEEPARIKALLDPLAARVPAAA